MFYDHIFFNFQLFRRVLRLYFFSFPFFFSLLLILRTGKKPHLKIFFRYLSFSISTNSPKCIPQKKKQRKEWKQNFDGIDQKILKTYSFVVDHNLIEATKDGIRDRRDMCVVYIFDVSTKDNGSQKHLSKCRSKNFWISLSAKTKKYERPIKFPHHRFRISEIWVN
jgi:hypothetical protein